MPSGNLPGRQTERAAPWADRQAANHFALLGLAPGGVCLAGDIAATAGGLLHHRFTLTDQTETVWPAIHLSVALAIGSPRPAVSRRRALWSADFPQPDAQSRPGRDHPADLVA